SPWRSWRRGGGRYLGRARRLWRRRARGPTSASRGAKGAPSPRARRRSHPCRGGHARMNALSDAFVAELVREFPRFRIVSKRESHLSPLIDLALRLITFGAQREFMTRYHTVLFDTLYVPDQWEATPDVARLITLHHERVHLRQRRRYGDVGMIFLYLVPF